MGQCILHLVIVTELLKLEKKVLETLEEEQQDRISVKDAWYADHFGTFADVLLSGELSGQHMQKYAKPACMHPTAMHGLKTVHYNTIGS